MSDEHERVRCKYHSETASTFMCRHLAEGVACGFHCSNDDPSDAWPDAWCDACQAAFEAVGDWNDSNQPELKLLCTFCYDVVRARNERLLDPMLVGQLSTSEEEYGALAQRAHERASARQETAKRLWPQLGSAKHWQYDLETRIIRFYDGRTEPALLADLTVVGSFSTNTNTWLWLWDNPNYSEANRAVVAPLRVFGEVRGIAKFREPKWPGDEVDAWEATQIAAELLDAAAIYRAPSEHLLIFMLLNNFRVLYPA